MRSRLYRLLQGWSTSYRSPSRIGIVIAPFPAESQAAKRTYAWPVASNGMVNVWLPKGGRSLVETTWVVVVSPSP